MTQHLIDAALTEKGRQEAAANQPAASRIKSPPTVLVVSPLQRAVDTGLVSFGHLKPGQPGGLPVIAHTGCG